MPELRLLGVVGSPQLNRTFYRAELGGAAARGAQRVLVAGAADSAMLAHVLDAMPAAAVTVIDRCPTPLLLSRWYGAMRGAAVAPSSRRIAPRRGDTTHEPARAPVVRGQRERAHGGALAAAGHPLADHAGELVVSATFSAHELRAWGSHPELDPLWSSSRLRVRHAGEQTRRILKLPQVAAHPLVQRHLRVCWEHRTADLNCSGCDKCLIAMVVLGHAGLLDDLRTLDGPEVIAERLDALPTPATSTATRRWPKPASSPVTYGSDDG